MSGCGQEKPAVSGAKPPVQSLASALEPASVTAIETPPEVLPETQSEAIPEATAAVPPKYEGYTRAYQQLQRIPPPMIIQDQAGLPDPNALNAYLNNLGAGVQQLQAEKQAVDQSLAPGEKRVWKQYQRSLQEEGE